MSIPGVPHVEEDLPALVSGELDIESLRSVTRHLRACPDCRAELVEIVAGQSALRRLEREAGWDEADPALSTLPPLPALPPEVGGPVTLRERRHRPAGVRARWLAAAAVIVVVGGVAAAVFGRGGGSPHSTGVALAPVSAVHGSGTVRMTGTGDARTMTVTTDLPPAQPGSFYEVWLLNEQTGGMVAVGVLPTARAARFSLPTAVVAHYDAVDISLQPDNGSTAHSSDSLLRARYSI